MPNTKMSNHRSSFSQFYREVFLPEHRHPANVALHVLGTLAALVFLAGTLTLWQPWFALLFPVVHAGPGLVGHRLFERNAAVGDMRVTRKDFPALWFIAGNHRMSWELATRGFHWRAVN